MKTNSQNATFQSLNNGYNTVFRYKRLSIGLVVPIEEYATDPLASMENHLEKVKLAEQLGFSSVWLRDVPFNVPSFGDAGQLFDPFVYLGYLAGQTKKIALGVSSIVLPLRHPAHVAKAATSIDALSRGRLILGVASGDRPEEYPAMNLNYANRGERFRESFDYIRAMQNNQPTFKNSYGEFNGDIDMLPKAAASQLPLLITGSSQQSPQWIAKNGDGWMIYPRAIEAQQHIIEQWQQNVSLTGRQPQPILQPLYFNLTDQVKPQPLHLGFSGNAQYLLSYLKKLESIGVNHVALNLRFNNGSITKTLEQIAKDVLPEFST